MVHDLVVFAFFYALESNINKWVSFNVDNTVYIIIHANDSRDVNRSIPHYI